MHMHIAKKIEFTINKRITLFAIFIINFFSNLVQYDKTHYNYLKKLSKEIGQKIQDKYSLKLQSNIDFFRRDNRRDLYYKETIHEIGFDTHRDLRLNFDLK
jgi:hypothetical protein